MKKGNLLSRAWNGLKGFFNKKEKQVNHYQQVETEKEIKSRVGRFQRKNNRKDTRGRVAQRVPYITASGRHAVKLILHSI